MVSLVKQKETHMRYHLKSKSNDLLISDLKELVKKERELQAELLQFLKEVENRRLYLEKRLSFSI